MSIPWQKVLTDPLGLCGYALFLVFGIVTYVVKQKTPANRWIVPTGISLAAICVLGGLALAYHREPAASMSPANTAAPSTSLRIDKVDQKIENGNAIAGVQGNVTVTSTPPPAKKPDHKHPVHP